MNNIFLESYVAIAVLKNVTNFDADTVFITFEKTMAELHKHDISISDDEIRRTLINLFNADECYQVYDEYGYSDICFANELDQFDDDWSGTRYYAINPSDITHTCIGLIHDLKDEQSKLKSTQAQLVSTMIHSYNID